MRYYLIAFGAISMSAWIVLAFRRPSFRPQAICFATTPGFQLLWFGLVDRKGPLLFVPITVVPLAGVSYCLLVGYRTNRRSRQDDRDRSRLGELPEDRLDVGPGGFRHLRQFREALRQWTPVRRRVFIGAATVQVGSLLLLPFFVGPALVANAIGLFVVLIAVLPRPKQETNMSTGVRSRSAGP